MVKRHIFGETDFTIGFADPIFPIQCTTFVELRLQKIDFYENTHYTKEILNFGIWRWRLKFLDQSTKRHTLLPNLIE